MVAYSQRETSILETNHIKIYSFLKSVDANLDPKTVLAFGEEWNRFNSFKDLELSTIGNDYFDIAPLPDLNMVALDVGCGSGRWARYLQSKVKFIEAIDPSQAVYVAASQLYEFKNIRVTQASV